MTYNHRWRSRTAFQSKQRPHAQAPAKDKRHASPSCSVRSPEFWLSSCMQSYAASMRPSIRSQVDEGIRFFSPPCSWSSTSSSSRFFVRAFNAVHNSREPVPLCHEQVDFYPQGQDVSLCVFVVLAKRIRELIRVMCCIFEFLLGPSMVFYDLSQLIHQATVMEICWKSALNYFKLFPIPGSWHGTSRFQLEVQHRLVQLGCNNCNACNTRLRPLFLLTQTFWDVLMRLRVWTVWWAF